jgi:hypothetical protein
MLPLGSRLSFRAKTLFLFLQFQSQLWTEILWRKDLSNLDLALAGKRIWTLLQPFDRFFLRIHLPDPITGGQLFCLREWSIDDSAPALTCCAVADHPQKPPRAMPARSHSPPTIANADTSNDACARFKVNLREFVVVVFPTPNK